MKGSETSVSLKCLTVAVALALLAAPTVQARAANSGRGPATTGLTMELRSATSPPHRGPNQLRPKHSAKSYFWAEAGVAAGVLAGFVALGLWGDAAIGGLIFGVMVLGAGAAVTARKACERAREAFGREAASDTPPSETPVAGAQAYAGCRGGPGYE